MKVRIEYFVQLLDYEFSREDPRAGRKTCKTDPYQHRTTHACLSFFNDIKRMI
jgi:hypothetical protein